MTYDIPPQAVEVIRTWGSRYQSSRRGARRHVGMTCLGLELGYGKGEARKAENGLRMALANGRMPSDRFHDLAFLMHQTSDSAWALLKTAMPANEWATICAAVNMMRDRAREEGRTFTEPLPERRRGRPTDALRAW